MFEINAALEQMLAQANAQIAQEMTVTGDTALKFETDGMNAELWKIVYETKAR